METGRKPTEQELVAAIHHLVERERAQCLWFWRPDYLPNDHAAMERALKYIEQRGTRSTFIEARRLRQWLSQSTSAKSAG
jgi:hypothetical protein